MSTKQTIVLKGNGHFCEGIWTDGVNTTVLPGSAVRQATSGMQLGCGAADGNRDLVALAVEDSLVGKTVDDAMSGVVRYYIPQLGDEVLLRVPSGQTLTPGTLMICDTSAGKWIATTGTPEMEPFIALESVVTTADTLVIARRV